MDLDLTDDQELLRETTARFIEADCDLVHVRALADSATGVDEGYLAKGAELGWFALLVSEELGGGSISGSGLRDAVVIAEERGRQLQPGPFVPANVVAFALSQAGNDEQQNKILPSLIDGSSVATWAIANATGAWEPGSGVQATPSGTGYVLNGRANLVQDAELADWILVVATSAEGLCQFLLPASAPGLTVNKLESLDLSRRFGEVVLDGVQADAGSAVGAPGQSADLIERELQVALVLTVSESVGAMNRIFEITLDYAKARTAFGRPIGSFQAIKHSLADTGLLLEMAQGMATAAARAVGDERPDAGEVASMAKSLVGDNGVALSQNCFQTFGGIGYTWEHDQHLFLRRLAMDALLYGEPAAHRERICQLHDL
ncbi:MAG TPA: acyl-CoA dehydrogenase family protein [Acidimicrobiales bacterium]|jgi:alkylation response protein AidB-like acyl-CoA dehydrogenase